MPHTQFRARPTAVFCLSALGIVLLGAPPLAGAQTVSADAVAVDPKSHNAGTLSGGLTFGGPIAAQEAAANYSLFPQLPRTGTLPSGAGIASNRAVGQSNLYGLDFYTPLLTPGSHPFKRMSITVAGNVGIGTATPRARLEIDADGDVQLGIRNTANDGRFWVLQNSGSARPDTAGDFQIIDRTAKKSRLAIDPEGQVSVTKLRITGGSDLAEPFRLADARLAPGSVVVIDPVHAGQLRLSSVAYDKRVAGVISGAGGIRPGLTLTQGTDSGAGQSGHDGPAEDVALSGRVYVMADASSGPIEPGDLLTTSATPGHCMKASDHTRTAGAVLGKAMTRLATGKGLVLALVTLQ
jgi:hypothetical protein